MAPMAVVPTQIFLSRELIRLVRQLHLASPQPPVRQRALLQELCRLFEAQRGSIHVMGIDPDTGASRIVHSFTLEGASPNAASDIKERVSARTAATRRNRSNSGGNNGADEGPVHEAFVPLGSVHRMARLSLVREPGRRRFSPAERGLIDLIHSECAWVYDGMEHELSGE